LKDFDFFLADIRIYKLLPELLGKEFYAKKAFPCPIKVHDCDLEEQLNAACRCSYFTMGNGPNYSIKIGKVSSMEAKSIAKNAETALGHILGYVCCWDQIAFENVSCVSISSCDTIELPVYNHFTKEEINAFMSSE
jgi:ribosomal protein L1